MAAVETQIEISVEDLAGSLDVVLQRIQHEGVRFVVTDGGRSVATIASTSEQPAPAVTLAELIDRLGKAPRPDPGFADDLEFTRARKLPFKEVAWDS
jgi:hypothetical protein